MRILILGGKGMLGHRLCQELGPRHDVAATIRRSDGPGPVPEQVFADVDVREFAGVKRAFESFRPEAVVNAVGIVKQRPEARDPLPSLEVNAVFPHRLAELCGAAGTRVIHFSTDCVFSGKRGNYRETDPPDPTDLYGRTKLLGEIGAPHLTLRTSIIGPEKERQQGLVEWFLARRGTVKGYRRAIFSGLTTVEMARVVELLLTQHPGLSGLYHLAARPIDKHALLETLAKALGRDDVRIEPVDEPAIDRSLNAEAFSSATDYAPPSWDDMLTELAQDIRQRRT